MKKIIIRLIPTFILLSLAYNVYSAQINAKSCAFTDVQSAIASSSSGDTIILPVCSSPAWSSRLEITKQNLTIQGQGTSNTTINGFGFLISTLSHGTTITGIHFNAGTNVPVIRVSSGNDFSGTPVTDWVIDGNKFTTTKSGCISIFNGSTGLVSNNEFLDTNTDATIYVWGRDDIDWSTPSFHGEAGQNVFIEDNKFVATSITTNHAILSGWGGSYIFRCNKVTDSGGNNTYKDMVDVHGYGHGTNRRGGRAAEVYGNYFDNRNYSSRTINLRSGSGRIFANRWINSSTYIGLTDYRMIGLGLSMAYPTNTADCSTNSANCASSAEATCCSDHEGYPCCDQIGRGQDLGGASRQETDPYYFWDNKTTTGADISITPSTGTPANFIQKNRDFYNGSPPTGYTPYTYPHPARGISPTGKCLIGVDSASDTDILFWSGVTSPPPPATIQTPKGFETAPL